MNIVRLICAGAALLAASFPAFAVTELQLWHSLEGPAAAELERITDNFNGSQTAYRVVPSYKGGSRDALTAAIAAQRSGDGPHIVQVDENAIPLAEESPKSFSPLYQVLAQSGEPLKTAAFVPAVEQRFTDERGRLLSLPFNTSTPVLYYNRDVFKAAGLDPDKPPHTWLEVQAAALQLLDAGAAKCGFTTDAPGWVHLENVLAQHNEPMSSGQGAASRLVFNTHLLILHVGLLSSWVSSGLFKYFGGREAEQRFASGECGMLTGASASAADIERKAEFKMGIAPLPVHADLPVTDNLVPRGGSLWVTAGKKKAEYAGVAKFFAFLSRPEVQAEWHQATGFLPTTLAAFELTRQQGFYDRHPGADIPMRGMGAMKGMQKHAARFAQLVSNARLLPIFDEELAAVWSTRSKTPKEALDDAVERGNKLLKAMVAPRKGR